MMDIKLRTESSQRQKPIICETGCPPVRQYCYNRLSSAIQLLHVKTRTCAHVHMHTHTHTELSRFTLVHTDLIHVINVINYINTLI